MVRSELLVRGEYEGKKERRLKLFPLWSHLFLFLVNFPPALYYLIVWNSSLPADVLWGSFVTHSFHECVTNEPQRTSAARLMEQAIHA